MKIIGILGYTAFVGIAGAVGGLALTYNAILKSPRLRNLLDADIVWHSRQKWIDNHFKTRQYGKNIDQVNFDDCRKS